MRFHKMRKRKGIQIMEKYEYVNAVGVISEILYFALYGIEEDDEV
jgi:hypothetical protein